MAKTTNAVEILMKRYSISKKQMAEATLQDQLEIVQAALDQLSVALTNHDHIWTNELRSLYEAATEITEALRAKGVLEG